MRQARYHLAKRLPAPMPHHTAREPNDKEHAELKRTGAREAGRVATRAHIVLLSSRGHSAPEIADLHEVAHPTVYKWIGRFDMEGLPGLYDREREGHPPKLGTDVHLETVRDALTERMEYSWKRPRRSLPPPSESEFADRIGRIDRSVASADPQTTVLFEDGIEFKRFPPLRRAWMRTGEQCPVEVPEQNGKFALHGALPAGQPDRRPVAPAQRHRCGQPQPKSRCAQRSLQTGYLSLLETGTKSSS